MYQYKGSGLPNVWLVNGYHKHETPYGEGVSIEDVAGLHKAIGLGLIRNPKRLSAAEFRFLRKEQELSQKKLSEILGADAQAVARWETSKTRVPKWADHFLRVLYQEYCEGNGGVRGLIDALNAAEKQEHEKLRFQRRDEGWLSKLAA